jgi:hypothetical protein
MWLIHSYGMRRTRATLGRIPFGGFLPYLTIGAVRPSIAPGSAADSAEWRADAGMRAGPPRLAR